MAFKASEKVVYTEHESVNGKKKVATHRKVFILSYKMLKALPHNEVQNTKNLEVQFHYRRLGKIIQPVDRVVFELEFTRFQAP